MSAADIISGFGPELIAIRRDIHAHPELGFEEFRTSELVATKLADWGIEVHRNVGRTGVVGVLRKGNGQAAIGLRADMDALPILEANGLPYASTKPGVMHACGHDGHTAMLLGAAKYLARSGTFNGTVTFIFQPAEEGLGGALAMLEDGLMERFPMDSVFGIHTAPKLPLGRFSIRPGAMMAGGGFFDITITGTGAHGAHPEQSADPVLAAATLAQALQSIVSRNVKPTDTAVVSLTWIESGAAYNVIPGTAVLRGTVRAYKSEVIDLVEARMRLLSEQIAAGFGAKAEVDFRYLFAPLVNDTAEAGIFGDAAAALVGEANVDRNCPTMMASEDFSFMMEKRPGARINIGNGADSVPVHNAMFDFNDESLVSGAAVLATLVEMKLPTGAV